MTSPIERNYKETPMVKQCNENKLTAIRETIELSNDIGVSGNHDGDTILKYLRNNDKASEPQDISRRTGIALDTIMATLLSLESQRLAANCEGKWWACEVNKHG